EDVLGLFVRNQVQVLVDGVGRAAVPLRTGALLGGHAVDELPHHGAEPPATRDVGVERLRLVLGEHLHPQHAGVGKVGEDEIDDPVSATERGRRLGPLLRQGSEPAAFSSREDHGERFSERHERTVAPGEASRNGATPGCSVSGQERFAGGGFECAGFGGGGFDAAPFFGTPFRSANCRTISSISFCALRTSWARSWKVRNELLNPATRMLRMSPEVSPKCLETTDSSFVMVVSVINRLSVLIVTRMPKSR